jgi:tetratricopeptide (TPR) repeat protein
MRAKLVLCLVLALASTGAAQAEELPLAQAEKELKAAAGLPAKKDRGAAAWRSHAEQLEQAFRAATAQNPGRAYLGLGRCQLLLGRYGDAVASFRKALRRAPNQRATAADLHGAGELAAIARVVRPLLPRDSVVVQIAPFRAEHRKLWLVLSATLEPRKPWSDDEFYQNARLRLFRETAHGLEQAWRSEVVRVGYGPGWTNDIRIYALEETPPKVMVGAVFYGAGWAPAHLEVFAWRGGKLAKVFALDSEESFWIQDLNGDGRHEIGGFQKIGSGLAIADMPRWSDIYAYEGGTYMLANQRFPKAFLEIGGEIRQRLEEHPDNHELLKCLGIYYEIEGDLAAALDAYRRALTAHTAQEQAPSEREEREVTGIRARIQRLGG